MLHKSRGEVVGPVTVEQAEHDDRVVPPGDGVALDGDLDAHAGRHRRLEAVPPGQPLGVEELPDPAAVGHLGQLWGYRQRRGPVHVVAEIGAAEFLSAGDRDDPAVGEQPRLSRDRGGPHLDLDELGLDTIGDLLGVRGSGLLGHPASPGLAEGVDQPLPPEGHLIRVTSHLEGVHPERSTELDLDRGQRLVVRIDEDRVGEDADAQPLLAAGGAEPGLEPDRQQRDGNVIRDAVEHHSRRVGVALRFVGSGLGNPLPRQVGARLADLGQAVAVDARAAGGVAWARACGAHPVGPWLWRTISAEAGKTIRNGCW